MELWRLAEEARSVYIRLNDAYDFLLMKSHECDHGSTEMIAALKKANAIGPEVAQALKRYHDAVSEMYSFYSAGGENLQELQVAPIASR